MSRNVYKITKNDTKVNIKEVHLSMKKPVDLLIVAKILGVDVIDLIKVLTQLSCPPDAKLECKQESL